MKLSNETGFPATLVRASLLYRDLMLATAVLKASFVVEDGRVRPLPDEEQLPIAEEDTVTALGTLDGDVVPVKGGCDFAVLGHARSQSADHPVDRVNVAVSVGPFSRRAVVTGDRVWASNEGGPVPTAPVPFSVLPLVYERAFGGSAIVEGELAAPYAPNPQGRGYIRRPEFVPGTPLPNLEEIEEMLTSWNQTPTPAGFAPLPRASSLRLAGGGFAVDAEKECVQLNPAAFSFAHPRMRLERYPAGEVLTMEGLTHGGRWQFALPTIDLALAVTLGSAQYELPLVVDTLCVLPDYRRFFVLARRAFVYEIRPERARLARLGPRRGGAAATSSIAEQRRASVPSVAIVPAAEPHALPLPFDALLALYPLTRIVERLPLCPSG